MSDPVFMLEFPGCDGEAVRRWLLAHARRDQICWVYPERALPDLSAGPGSAVWLPPQIAGAMGPAAARTFALLYGQFGFGFHPNRIAQPRYLAVLRDPVTRLAVMLDEIAAGRMGNPVATRDAAACATAAEFLQQQPMRVLDNALVRRLSGTGAADYGSIGAAECERALANARAHLEILDADDDAAIRQRLAGILGVGDPGPLRRRAHGPRRARPGDYGIDRSTPAVRWDVALMDALQGEGCLAFPAVARA
jgi:hypothetical protein